MTRIGIVTTSYPRFAGDPAGHFVESHAHALAQRGYAVEVVAAGPSPHAASRAPSTAAASRTPSAAAASRTPSAAAASRTPSAAAASRTPSAAAASRTPSAAAASRTPSAAAAGSVTVRRVPSAAGLFDSGGAPDALEHGSLATTLSAAAFTARLAAAVAVRARRWDAILAHWLAPSALAALPSHLPLLAIAHGGDIYTLRRLGLLAPALHALRARRARLAFVSADLLAAARAATRSRALHAYLDAALVQPMGLDLARFAAIPRAPTAIPTILVAARLAPIKGVDVALAALAHLRRPAHLVIAGDGPEHAALAALAPRNATLLGAVTTRERDELLGRAHVVVVPSRALANGRTEGTPLIALEALAAGIPVIASATGGLRALAPAAILVPPDHPAILAAAIDHALTAPAPSGSALRAAVAHLDWSRVATVLAPTQLPA